MADIKGRYPFSTADGQAIPLDIIRPNSFIQLDIDDTVPTGPQDCPETVEVMAVVATEDCYIQFAATGATAAAIASGDVIADAAFIPGGVITMICPPIGMKSYSILSLGATGYARVQYLEQWSGLALSSQQTRR